VGRRLQLAGHRDVRVGHHGVHVIHQGFEAGVSPVVGPGQVDRHFAADPAGIGAKNHHPIGQIDRLLDVVGDDQDAFGGEGSRVPEVVDLARRVFGGEHVEGAERLIHEERLGLQHKGPGEAHPLLHAAGELLRIGVFKAVEAHDVDRRGGLDEFRGNGVQGLVKGERHVPHLAGEDRENRRRLQAQQASGKQGDEHAQGGARGVIRQVARIQ